jgi:hypothetical protein
MKFGFEGIPSSPQNEEEREQPESTSRRDFLKNIGKLAIGAAILGSPAKSLAYESREKPPVVARPTWDADWGEISKQYNLKIGEEFTATVNGVTSRKRASILPYFNENFASGRSKTLDSNHRFEDLQNVYRRVAIHHTDIGTSGASAYQQAKTVRDIELNGALQFNDIGYHFLIASDGTILEARPTGRVGSNAGQTKEANDLAKKYFPNSVSDIFNASGADYMAKLQVYTQIMHMDPDYGTMGIALCGNFDNGGQPSPQQQQSLTKLLNWVKGEYDIPSSNMLYHKEIKSRVIEASGLTFVGTNGAQDTVCPGRTFPSIQNFTNKLNPDTPHSKSKTILLDRFQ